MTFRLSAVPLWRLWLLVLSFASSNNTALCRAQPLPDFPDAPETPGSCVYKVRRAGGVFPANGDVDEWDLSENGPDFVARMYEAGKSTKEHASNFCARIECANNRLCMLVNGEPTLTFLNSFWFKDYDTANSEIFPIGGSNAMKNVIEGVSVVGWEACFSVTPGPSSSVEVHANYRRAVDSEGESRTSSTGKPGQNNDICLDFSCPIDTPAPVDPETPAPVAPSTPAPQNPTPETPAPIDPVTPAPVDPETPAAPSTPAPQKPTPGTPAPSDPVTPAPIDPATPAPVAASTPAPQNQIPGTHAPQNPSTPSPSILCDELFEDFDILSLSMGMVPSTAPSSSPSIGCSVLLDGSDKRNPRNLRFSKKIEYRNDHKRYGLRRNRKRDSIGFIKVPLPTE